MRRDPDLVRKMLLALEKEPYTGTPVPMRIEGYSNEEIVYHVILLSEAGLIEAFDLGFGEVSWMPIRLTWAGHEFLEAARDDDRWERTKETIANKSGGMVFEVLKELLVGMVRRDMAANPGSRPKGGSGRGRPRKGRRPAAIRRRSPR